VRYSAELSSSRALARARHGGNQTFCAGGSSRRTAPSLARWFACWFQQSGLPPVQRSKHAAGAQPNAALTYWHACCYLIAAAAYKVLSLPRLYRIKLALLYGFVAPPLTWRIRSCSFMRSSFCARCAGAGYLRMLPLRACTPRMANACCGGASTLPLRASCMRSLPGAPLASAAARFPWFAHAVISLRTFRVHLSALRRDAHVAGARPAPGAPRLAFTPSLRFSCGSSWF